MLVLKKKAFPEASIACSKVLRLDPMGHTEIESGGGNTTAVGRGQAISYWGP